MSDNVAVMSEGVIDQVGDGNTIYDRPESAFVASFVGENNLFRGKVTDTDDRYAMWTRTSARCGRGLPRAAETELPRATLPSSSCARVAEVRERGQLRQHDRRDGAHRGEFEGQFWHVFLDVPAATSGSRCRS